MPITYFDNVGGRILAETTDGVRTVYGTDALGSVTTTFDGSGNVLNRYLYKPYGDRLAKIGTAPDPAMQFCGSWGYWSLGRKYASHSVRYRVLDVFTSRWTTVDPLWPGQKAYTYLDGRPVALVDYFGTDPLTLAILQEQLYLAWRNTMLRGAPHWQKLLDTWWYELGPGVLELKGDNAWNRSIKANAGFQKMFTCFVQLNYGSEEQKAEVWFQLSKVRPGNNIDDLGFSWHYLFLVDGLSANQTPGRQAAYEPTTHFLGSYSAEVLGGDHCYPCGPIKFDIVIKNTSGMASASRKPWNPSHSVWADHKRGHGPYKPSRGGNFKQRYIFTSSFNTCDLEDGKRPCQLP